MPQYWYKNSIVYELYVRGFKDSTDDGNGDIRGLISKLDYLEDLGVDCLWLLPIYPSPGKDDGYDISDYYKINKTYGTIKDFTNFIEKAHKKNIRVIGELVLNHTSDQHPWFLEAKTNTASKYHNYYIWSDDITKYSNARIIFSDYEKSNWAWCPENGKYYWHRFFHHQPDLNFDNPEVREEMKRVVEFWFDLGLDGFRVDAVPYLFEREGTSCENLPETHAYIQELHSFIDTRYDDKVLVAEANQWPEDLVSYFGNGDEFHMAFNFPLMPRMFMALKQEHHGPIVDIIKRTPQIPENCQWVIFLRNHDELTLEMVTDEERDYMYRAYAEDRQMRLNKGIRRRLSPLLENDRKKYDLLNAMLFTLPGTPVIYYGDELGMGDNIFLGDRNGVRTPMQWNEDRNAGFSKSNPSKMYAPVITDPYYNYHTINVEAQMKNQHSCLNFIKLLIKIRKKYEIFGSGSIIFLYPDNKKVLVFLREHGDQKILCVFNLAHTAQPVELCLQDYAGHIPFEILGETKFPQIGELPYFLTLGPYGYYIFHLRTT